MFRNLILIGMAVAAASMAGWISISREGDHTTVKFNRAEFREDAGRAIDRGRQYLDEREQRLARDQETQTGRWNQSYDLNHSNQNYSDRTYQTERTYGADQYRANTYQNDTYGPQRYQGEYYPDNGDQQSYRNGVQYREAGYQQNGQVYRGSSPR